MKFFLVTLLISISNLSGALTIGDKAPNLIGRSINNTIYRLYEDKQTAKIMNFFWIGCAPCKKEMQELAKLEKKYPNIQFLSIHSKDNSQEEVKKFISSLDAAPSHIILAGTIVHERFSLTGLPYTLVLDQNNTVIKDFSGYTSENMRQLELILKRLDAPFF